MVIAVAPTGKFVASSKAWIQLLQQPVAPAEIHGLLSIWLTMSDETETPS